MPLSLAVSIVSVLTVIGVISLCDAVIKLFIREKNNSDTHVVLALTDRYHAEFAADWVAKQYPAAEITLMDFAENDDILREIIHRKYPNFVDAQK